MYRSSSSTSTIVPTTTLPCGSPICISGDLLSRLANETGFFAASGSTGRETASSFSSLSNISKALQRPLLLSGEGMSSLSSPSSSDVCILFAFSPVFTVSVARSLSPGASVKIRDPGSVQNILNLDLTDNMHNLKGAAIFPITKDIYICWKQQIMYDQLFSR